MRREGRTSDHGDCSLICPWSKEDEYGTRLGSRENWMLDRGTLVSHGEGVCTLRMAGNGGRAGRAENSCDLGESEWFRLGLPLLPLPQTLESISRLGAALGWQCLP